MTVDERRIVADLIINTCPVGPPANFHINGDLLRRITGFPMSKIKQTLGNLSSLGFFLKIVKLGQRGIVEQSRVDLEYHAMRVSVEQKGPHNALVEAIVEEIGELLCEDCVRADLIRGDFSQLSSATMEYERHKQTRSRLLS